MELQEQLDTLQQRGIGVAAISYDTVDVVSDFSERRGITFPLLADPESRVIKSFGILNTVAEEGVGIKLMIQVFKQTLQNMFLRSVPTA